MTERRVALGALALLVAIKSPSLQNPFYWDEAGAYMSRAIAIAKQSVWTALPGLHPKGALFGHPPVLYLIHGALYKMCGGSLAPHHAVQLIFAFVGVWYTYRLGALICNRSTGVCAAVLLFLSPMFFAQSAMVLGDMPITSLGVASVYYLVAEQPFQYAVTATLLLQSKETALAIGVAAALYWFVVRRPPQRHGWSSVLMHGVPLGSLAAFYAVEYASTGTLVQNSFFLSNPLLSFDPSSLQSAVAGVLHAARWVGRVLFVGEGRIILTATIVLAAVLHGRNAWKAPFSVFALIIAFHWAAFSLIVFLPRYVMPALPYLCIAASWSAYVLMRERAALQAIVAGATAIGFLTFFFARSESGTFETNMRHEQAIAVSARACQYVENALAGSNVVADFPMSAYLRVPELGYVRSPVTDVMAAEDVRLPRRTSDKPLALVYFSIGPSPQLDALRQRAGELDLRLQQRFEEAGIVAEVYAQNLRPGQ